MAEWSTSEKKVARRAYDAALKLALDRTIAEFKSKAAAVENPAEMWAVEDFLRESGREIDRLFDYRYSQLIDVFANLIRLGYLDENSLAGLSEDKRQMIRKYASWNVDG